MTDPHGTNTMTAQDAPENLKQRLKESYDAIAPKYNKWTIPKSEQRLHYLDRLLDCLNVAENPRRSILELGCGGGVPVTQRLLQHERFRVVANDLSGVQIEEARRNLGSVPAERLDLVEGDMFELSFAASSLDAVIGLYSLIHLPCAEQDAMIKKIAAWLKPGGHFLANFSEEATSGVVYEEWLDPKGWVYWSGHGAEGTVAKVREAGLEIVIGEVAKDAVDASFMWIIGRKPI